MVQVWTARNSPPSGDTTASSTAAATPNTALREPRDGELRLGQVVRGRGGGRAVGDLGCGRQRRDREARDDLRERRVLGPVVVAGDDARVARLEAGRDLLAGPQVVVLVEVDRQALDRDQAGREGDERDEDDRRPGHEAAGDGQPVHPPESSPLPACTATSVIAPAIAAPAASAPTWRRARCRLHRGGPAQQPRDDECRGQRDRQPADHGDDRHQQPEAQDPDDHFRTDWRAGGGDRHDPHRRRRRPRINARGCEWRGERGPQHALGPRLLASIRPASID